MRLIFPARSLTVHEFNQTLRLHYLISFLLPIYQVILMSTGTISILFPLYTLSQHALAHSEKFKTNEEVDSLLSEKISNLLLT